MSPVLCPFPRPTVSRMSICTQAELAPGGATLVTSKWTSAKLWDAETGKELATLPKTKGIFNSTIAFSRDGRTLIIADDIHQARICEARSGKEIASFMVG